ncbi:hypothetical protein HDU76_006875 [Blyttiomyces sp. JEL0837]|nr:hypothetical protein HDU76_006875 [Blyttiomyces sp. JEL0837]
MHAITSLITLTSLFLTSTVSAQTTTSAAGSGGVNNNQNLTCAPFSVNDPICGFLAPAPSVLKLGEASGLNASFTPSLISLCPDLAKYAATVPVVFCLGSLGPCNNATFVLPATTNGIPDLTATANFYNTAKFAEVLPALAKLNVTPPCYDLCSNVAKSITTCPALSGLGINPAADPCAGLPTTNCATKIGFGPGGSAVSVTPTGATSTGSTTSPTTSATKNGASGETVELGVAALVAVLVGGVVGF